ncbi:MAG: SDR family oxidoreductase [Aggregatilineales bacterium]
MAAPYGTVLVVGATGETGRHVVRILRECHIPVRALARSPEKAEAIKGDGVQIHLGDLNDDLPWNELMDGVQAVITTLGTRLVGDLAQLEAIEYIAVGRIVDEANVSGVSHLVFTSSIGTQHPDSIPFLSQILWIKRKAELYVMRSPLTYTIVRPGGLTNDPPMNAVKVGRGDTLQGRITRADVAQVLVQALLQPEARNQAVEIVNEQGAGPADRPGLFAPSGS